LPKADAENVKSSADRTTKLTVSTDLNVTGPGLWTTTTKNNPMIGSGVVEQSLVPSLARWINKREHHILDGAVGVPAPSWMEGPVANQPGGFSYSKDFGFSGARINLARYKYSLSTCSGCHNGDTGAFFQMVKSRGKTNKAFFDAFMVGNKKGGPHTQSDGENLNEKHEFFDLQGREVIVRDILNIAEQVDAARLRLSRVEFDRNELNVLAKVFVNSGWTMLAIFPSEIWMPCPVLGITRFLYGQRRPMEQVWCLSDRMPCGCSGQVNPGRRKTWTQVYNRVHHHQ